MLLLVRHLLLVAMHLFLVASCYYSNGSRGQKCQLSGEHSIPGATEFLCKVLKVLEERSGSNLVVASNLLAMLLELSVMSYSKSVAACSFETLETSPAPCQCQLSHPSPRVHAAPHAPVKGARRKEGRKEKEGKGRKRKEKEGKGRKRKEKEGKGRKRKEKEGKGRKRKETCTNSLFLLCLVSHN